MATEDELPEELLRIARENAEMMSQSAFFLLPFIEPPTPEQVQKNILPILQLGMAVYFNKPLLLSVPDTHVLHVPDNLRRLATFMEVYKDGDMEDFSRAITALLTQGAEYVKSNKV